MAVFYCLWIDFLYRKSPILIHNFAIHHDLGIISHVEAIVERIAVQVRLSRIAPGKSTVSVVRT